MIKSEKGFEKFVKIVKKLRQECPWDQQLTIENIKPYLVEEVYEAMSAIDDKDYDRLCEELGDMLLHIVMVSVFAKEDDLFDINDVIKGISEKMVRRHPHVFGSKKAKNAEQVLKKWEKIKRKERKGKKSLMDGVPKSLPALYKAEKVQKRAARVGFDWDNVAGAWEKVHEELNEVKEQIPKNLPAGRQGTKQTIPKSQKAKIEEEIGDLLFAVTNVARKLDINAEQALQDSNAKFIKRFSVIEKELQKKKLSLKQMDALWDQAKKVV